MKKCIYHLPISGLTLSGLLLVSPITQANEQETVALAVAKAVDTMVRSTRATYTKTVVTKLKKDGKGAKQKSNKLKGFVPLPAQFVRNVAIHSEASGKANFTVALRSAWNLNLEQGLQDEFERQGWDYLMQQQAGQADNLASINWQPYTQISTIDGVQTLRYFSADTAVGGACVSCHNNWEGRDMIKAVRTDAGLEAGKQFVLHELMGAVSISVPMN